MLKLLTIIFLLKNILKYFHINCSFETVKINLVILFLSFSVVFFFFFWKGIERDTHLPFQSDCKCDFDQSHRSKFSLTVTEVVILTLTIKITKKINSKEIHSLKEMLHV